MNSFQDILRMIAARNPTLKARLEEAKVLGRWADVAGPMIAKHTNAIKVEYKMLYVEVDHPTWKAEIIAFKRQLIEKLNKGVPEELRVTDLFFIDKRSQRSVPSTSQD